MSAHRIPFDIHAAPVEKVSSVNAETIIVDRSPCVINLRSLGVETRTLAIPTRAGVLMALHCQLHGGDITVTITSGYDTGGDTTFVFSATGQFAFFQSYMDSSGAFFWRLISHYGIGNLTPAQITALQLQSVSAVVGVAGGYKIARGVSAVTGTATVVTGLATVVAIVATAASDLDGDSLAGVSATIGDQAGAPAAGSVILKAWKVTTGGAAGNPTLIAATAAKNLNWIAIGT